MNSPDWKSLNHLRSVFLKKEKIFGDYWNSEIALSDYDDAFGRRIKWKWDYVLSEIKNTGWMPPSGSILDWACGSGVAIEAMLDNFRAELIEEIYVWDESKAAMEFSRAKLKEKFKGRAVNTEERPCDTVLISHVVTELSEKQIENLLNMLKHAIAIIWVEPGTYEASHALIKIREKLRDSFNVVAPCTHKEPCPMELSENEKHWCHFFAEPPQEAFTEKKWAEFAKNVGIDLRSLPLSYLVLDKRPVRELPENSARLIAAPRIYKSHALILGCSGQGLNEIRVTKKEMPDYFKALKKNKAGSLYRK